MRVHAGSVVGATLAGAAMVPVAAAVAQQAGCTGVPPTPPRFWRRMRTAAFTGAALKIVFATALIQGPSPALAQEATGGGGGNGLGSGNGGTGGDAGAVGASGTGTSPGGGGSAGTSTTPNGRDGGGSFSTGGGGGGGGGFSFTFSGSIATSSQGGAGGDGGSGGRNTDSGGGGGGAGGDGARISASSPVIVSATVTGGNGGSGGEPGTPAVFGGGGGGGGAGVDMQTANGLTINAAVTGGSGGAGDGNDGGGGGGGAGIILEQGGTLVINAAVTGGAGGPGSAGGGNGGAGVVANAAANVTVSASGFVTGGQASDVGSGGAGLTLSAGGTVNNAGTIAGGAGGETRGTGGRTAGGTGAGGASGLIPNTLLEGLGGAGIIGANLTVINSGTISGGIGGDGTTSFRANAISFTGGINTLQLQPGYNIVGNVVGTGSDVFQLGGSGSSNFNLSSLGSTQQYQGFATFSVVGGNWTLTGANTTAVPFSVTNATATVIGTFNDTSATVNSGGILVVNGTLNDPTINSGGVLSGTGSVGATTINSGGTLAPGPLGGIGSLTINGSLAFASGALYVVYLNPTTSSFANVTGTASLAGTVNANFASGSYLAKQYAILTAASGLGGTTFAGLTNTNLPAGFTDSLSYSGNSVLLNLTATLGALSTSGLPQNQQNVANGLNNFFNSGGTLRPAFVNIFGLTGGALTNALTQLDGEAATGGERAVFQLTNEFLELMLDPFVNGRGNVGGGGPALGFAPERDSLPPDIALAYASILTKAPPVSFEQRWTAWGSAFGGANRTNGEPAAGSNNTTASTFGFAGGMDYHVTPYTVVGFALAGAGTNWGLANALGGGRSDALQAGAYGISWFGPAYIAGALSFSNHWFTTNRSALGDALTANFVGQGYGARLEGGYRYAVLPAFAVTPYGAVQFQDFRTPAYSETDQTGGGLGLALASMNATDVRTELGARFDDPTVIYNKPLILFGRLAWAHDFVSNPFLSAAFEALPGGTFTVNGAPIPRDSALTTAGAQLFLTPQWTLLAKFEGEFAPGSQTYAGTGTLRYSW